MTTTIPTTTDDDVPPPVDDIIDLRARERELHDIAGRVDRSHEGHDENAREFQIAFTAIEEIRRLRRIITKQERSRKTRLGLIATVVVGVISAGAMTASCVNSGIGYRQMRAIETIAEHAKDCPR